MHVLCAYWLVLLCACMGHGSWVLAWVMGAYLHDGCLHGSWMLAWVMGACMMDACMGHGCLHGSRVLSRVLGVGSGACDARVGFYSVGTRGAM